MKRKISPFVEWFSRERSYYAKNKKCGKENLGN
jgi:hypothetical protein